MGRLDDWLQAYPEKPSVLNPSLPSEDFADLWNETQYANFRNFINKYRKWIDDAIEESAREASIEKWRKVFGDEFAKSESPAKKSEASIIQQTRTYLMEGAAHLDSLVDHVIDFGITILPASFKTPTHLHPPPWKSADNVSRNVQVSAEYALTRSGRAHPIRSGEALASRGGVWFDVRVNKFEIVPVNCFVRWRITNTGAFAMALKKGRGGFELPKDGNRRWEELEYRGVHMAEAFIIRRTDDLLVGQSEPFYVVVK